jgi:hypothetical protein
MVYSIYHGGLYEDWAKDLGQDPESCDLPPYVELISRAEYQKLKDKAEEHLARREIHEVEGL